VVYKRANNGKYIPARSTVEKLFVRVKVPHEVYKKSERRFIAEHLELRYGKGFKTRYVNDRGYINWDNKPVFIGEPF